MNKPLAFVCGSFTGMGLLMLACSTFCTIVYGRGDFEAGNFHRNHYYRTVDVMTGRTVRGYDTRWELVESTEGSALAEGLDMWFVGIGLVALGAGLYLAEGPRFGREFPF